MQPIPPNVKPRPDGETVKITKERTGDNDELLPSRHIGHVVGEPFVVWRRGVSDPMIY